MDKEQKAMFSDMGKQAAYLYNGAFEVFQNSKQAEKIVFLFFFSDDMRNRLVSVAQKKVQIAIHTPARIAKRE